MRYPRGSNLLLRVRPLFGSAPHDVVWRAADSACVVQILKNPAYAGADAIGRWRLDPLCRNLAVSGLGWWPLRRGLVDLSEGRSSGLCRLGRVYGEP